MAIVRISKAILSVIMRLGFHAIAFAVSGFIGQSILYSKAWLTHYAAFDLSDLANAILVVSYLSLLLIFPYRSDRFSSKIGVIATLVALLWAPWQLVLCFGAFPAFFVQLVNRKSWCLGSTFVAIFLGIGLSVDDNLPQLFAQIMPGWYLGFLVFITLFGCYGNKFILINRLYDFVYNLPPKDQPTVVVNNKIDAVLETSVVTASNGPQIIKAEIQKHRDVLQQLIHYHKKLPYDLSRYLTHICEYSFKILDCMEKDPRDFEPGDRFLNRYLKATETIVNQFIELSQHSSTVPQINNLKQQLAQSLKDLANAFAAQHAKLLENDSTDLTVEVKLVDKLLKMEGFKNINE